jgi:lysozyme
MARRKSKTRIYLLRVALMLVLLGMGTAGWLAWVWWKSEEARSIRYPEFGVEMPTQYSIHGIDVSRYQQQVSWDAVRSMNVGGISLGFVFIKATEGASNTDPLFGRNWKRSRESGMIRGAYHFFIPSKSGRLQAEHFIKTVRLETGDLPPVVDIEDAGRLKPEALRKELKAWLDICQQYYGVRPIIYTYLNFYNRNLEGYFDDYPLWVAHYLQPEGPRIQKPWAFWQHSESGRVNGIRSKVDFDVYSGDSLSFRALLVP